ncbi:hypothetical protein T5B8_18768 [Salinisphaera sp. T5B8]|uniref:hypothetical protein n=1 Tax=Salinisphaera sp. T5B8 TaxID=1304154 RepID=UPI00333E1B5A
MISRHLFAFTALAAVAVLSGCAAAPPTMHKTDPSHSKAWNLTRAAGYEHLKDVEHEKVEQHLDSGGASVGGTLAAGGLGFLSNPNGLSLGANVGMNMLTNVLLGSDTPKDAYTRVVAWIPKSEAATADDATVQVNERVLGVMRDRLAAMEMPAPYHWGEVKQFDAFNYGYEHALYAAIRGGECEQEGFLCEVRVVSRPIGKSNEAVNAIAPESIGGFPSWRVHVGVGFYFEEADDMSSRAEIPLLRAYHSMSESLPTNYFIYVAPSSTPFQKNATEFALFPAPLVLHEGQALYFIEPASTES